MGLRVVEPAGLVPWEDLDSEVQEDVLISIKTRTGIPKDYTRKRFDSEPPLLQLVNVDPLEIEDPNQNLSEGLIEDYAQAMKRRRKFPPVIIDSRLGPVVALIEGRHRTAAAIMARKPRILAIDIAPLLQA